MGVVSVRGSRRGKFAFDLDVYVPALNNYTYTILSVSHGLGLYPVHVSAPAEAKSFTCENEDQYIQAVESILSSKRTKFVLSRLLSQASK